MEGYVACRDDEGGKRQRVRLPTSERSCTDLYCCVAFTIFIIAFLIVAALAFYYGDPRQILYPTDSYGRLCGVKTKTYDLTDKPVLFFFDLTAYFMVGKNKSDCSTVQTCQKECPNTYFAVGPASQYGDEAALKKLIGNLICSSDEFKKSLKTYDAVQNAVQEEKCALYYFASINENKRCVPIVLAKGWDAASESYIKNLITEPFRDLYHEYNSSSIVGYAELMRMSSRILEKVCSDLKDSWWQILLGLICAVLLAFIWIFMMRYFAACMVWTSIIFTGLLLYGLTIFCWYKCSTRLSNGSSRDSVTGSMAIAGAVFTTMAFLYTGFMCFLCCFFRRIKAAVLFIAEASKAVGDVFSSLFFPVLPALIHFAVLMLWVSVIICLVSTGAPMCVYSSSVPVNHRDHSGNFVSNGTSCTCPNGTNDDSYCRFAYYSFSGAATVGFVFCFFALLWFVFFIAGFNDMVLGGAFAAWYWAFKKPEDVPGYCVVESISRTVKHHLGSIALGSFLLATVRFLRYVLDWLKDKAKNENIILCIIITVLQCFCTCIEDLLRFLNKNAYILISVHGKAFCESAKEAFNLLTNNLDKVIVLNQITSILLFTGRVVIVLATVIVSYAFCSGSLVENLNFPLLPLFFIFVGSFIIINVFFEVYDMAIDTIFLCFLQDIQDNDGSFAKPYYMSAALKEILLKEPAATPLV